MNRNSKPKSKTISAGIQRKYRKEKLNQGLCVVAGCPNKLDSDNYCEGCLIKRRKYEKDRSIKRIDIGMCRKCTVNPAAEHLLICIECWWKQKAGSQTGSTKNTQALKDLWEKQGGKCAISGLPLTIGLNASIDHIIPKSKGGPKDIANIQWILFDVNSLKGSKSLTEVIALCKAIIAHNRPKRKSKL